MAAGTSTRLSNLSNPLASPSQLETSASQLDGVAQHVENAARFQSVRIMQAAGILLRLPQEIIAQSAVIFYRAVVGADGLSMLQYHPKDIAAASLYLTAKPSAYPLSPKSLLVTFEYLMRTGLDFDPLVATETFAAGQWYLSEGDYETARDRLYMIEGRILRAIGFQTHCALPHGLSITYLGALDLFKPDKGQTVAKRTFALLNTALLSPQLVYLTHQPTTLATAAIYLAARETDTKLPEVAWWEIFDVDREELGFLAVAFLSVEGFVVEEEKRWRGRTLPLTIDALKDEIQSNTVPEDP